MCFFFKQKEYSFSLKTSNLVFTGDHHDEAYKAEDEGDDEGDDDDNDEGMFIVKE